MDDTASASQRRRRPILACDPCRRKKIKCDHEVPCGPCKRSRTSRCSYLESSGGGGGSDDGGSKKAKTASTTSETPTSSISADVSVVGSESSSHSSPAVNSRAPWFDDGRNFSVLHGSLSQPVLSSLDLDGDGSHFIDRQESPLGRGTFLRGRFYGPSHWMSFFLHLPNAETDYTLFQDYETTMARANSVGSSLGRVSISASATSTTSSSSLSSMLVESIPPKDVGNQLVLSYLRTFETVLRVLHVPSFINECQQYWESPQDCRPSFLVMLGLVMAIGATFAPRVPHHTVAIWIEAAEDWLTQLVAGISDTSNGETTTTDIGSRASYRMDGGRGIELVQIFCLLLEARQAQGSEPKQSPTSVLSIDYLVRAAESTALHIDPTKLPGLSFFEQETRRRLWSTVQELALQAAIDEGRQPLLLKPESSGPAPMNLADDQFGPHSKTAPPVINPHQFTQTSIQIALHRSLPTRLAVADAINDVSNNICSYSHALQLSSQILTESQDILSRIQTATTRHNCFGSRLCELLLYRPLLTLHLPFALQARTDPTRYYSRKVATEVATSILRGALGSPGEAASNDDFTKLMRQGSQLFGRTPVLAASVLCYDLSDVEPFSANLAAFPSTRVNLLKLVEAYLQFLSQRIAVSPEGIRPFVLLSAQLARIDAIRSGGGRVPVDRRLAINRAFQMCQQIRQSAAARNVMDTEGGHSGDEISVVSSGESYVLDRQTMATDPTGYGMKNLDDNVPGSFGGDDPWMMGFT